jgi:hypothetical protein
MISGEELGEFGCGHTRGRGAVRFASARGDANRACRVAHQHYTRHTLVIGDRNGRARIGARAHRCLCSLKRK